MATFWNYQSTFSQPGSFGHYYLPGSKKAPDCFYSDTNAFYHSYDGLGNEDQSSQLF